MTEEIKGFKNSNLERRSLIKGAAWSVPVLATAVAAPAFAASGDVELGALQLEGTCGVLGLLGPGFTLTAGPEAIPAGTVINISGSGIANIGVFTITGGLADVAVLGAQNRSITLTGPLAAGQTLEMRTTLSISVAFQLAASITLPAGYIATGAKTSGSVSATLVLCSAT